jgi:hypothetical protein
MVVDILRFRIVAAFGQVVKGSRSPIAELLYGSSGVTLFCTYAIHIIDKTAGGLVPWDEQQSSFALVRFDAAARQDVAGHSLFRSLPPQPLV